MMSRKNFKILALMVVTIATFALLVVGCGQQAEPAEPTNGDNDLPVSGGDMVVAVIDDPPTFDVDRTTWFQAHQSILYDGLVERNDEDGSIGPKLAQDWDISEDGLEWTFYLREDVTFHCGEPFNAEAYKYRIDRMLDPEEPSANFHMVASVEGAEVVDEFTLKLTLKTPDAALWNFLGGAFGAPMCPACIEEHGEDYGHHPCGTGPFKLTEYVSGSHQVVERHEDYVWGAPYWNNQGPAHIESITFRYIADEATRMLELEQGTVDYVTPIPPPQVDRLRENPDVQIITFPSNGIRYWGFNCKREPWTNEAVRHAMMYAVDREAIADTAMGDLADPLWSSLPPSIAGYTDELESQFRQEYPFDPERTRAILQEEGWEEGPDGILTKDGKPFEIGVWVRNDAIDIRVAEMLEQNLRECGLKLDIEIMEQATLTSQTPQGLHETIIWMYGWYDPDILFHVFDGGGTRVHFVDEWLQDQLELGRSLIDMDDRLPIYEDVQVYLAEKAPWVPMYFPQSILGFSARVEDIRVNPYNGALLWVDLHLSE